MNAGNSDDQLSVREIQLEDIELIINYWLTADADFLHSMGVDITKMPSREEWRELLTEQIETDLKEKKSYCIIWLLNNTPVGHSNINKITYEREAYMHLHLWRSDKRKKGIGTEFIKLTLPYYFENFKLKTLYCEPYALNIAPNKTLEKAGFTFIKTEITTPGWINFEQPVNLWKMEAAKRSA